jgi:hypothetical protein
MAKNRTRKLRGIAAPVLVREPLLVRLCSSFVENLTLILRTGLILGAVLLVHDLRLFLQEITPPTVAESAPVTAVPDDGEAMSTAEARKPVLSERVIHALNCTYERFRNEHYDECVKDSSRIYPRPQADPDDTGYVIYDAPVLYARLDTDIH